MNEITLLSTVKSSYASFPSLLQLHAPQVLPILFKFNIAK